jgi:hypothetical protein
VSVEHISQCMMHAVRCFAVTSAPDCDRVSCPGERRTGEGSRGLSDFQFTSFCILNLRKNLLVLKLRIDFNRMY